jgi:hypothetical protein
VEKSITKKQLRHNAPNMNFFSSSVPTIVGPKGVYTRPSLSEFLAIVKEVTARIVVWSSMKRSTIEGVVKFFFNGLPQPFETLGQESCGKIEISRIQYLKGLTGSKEIFLKTLSETVFSLGSEIALFDSNNTILIDDSLEKNVCNETGNAIFIKSWTR